MITAKKIPFVHTLATLLPGLDLPSQAPVEVQGLTLDSRAVKPGDVFFAIGGNSQDGRQFIPAAIQQGAAAVLVEENAEWQGIRYLNDVPVIAMANLPQQISAIAARFYQSPSARLRVVGITGTNGKTTCSLLLAQLFAFGETRSGVVGTLGFGTLNSSSLAPLNQQISLLQHTGLTTPDAIRVQEILAGLTEEIPSALVAMEVSSHSLVQHRVAAVQFSSAIFTNLTADHLDYHGDMENYGQAKEVLLSAPGLRHALINADDAWAASLAARAPASVQVLSYSLGDSRADIYLRDMKLSSAGATASLVTPWGEGHLQTSLVGRFNISNLLAVIGVACCEGLPLSEVLEKLPELVPAPGRMQAVNLEQQHQPISVIVDYAHTPDALENTLQALREHRPAKIWTVFGCGGNRDKTKRPLMGRIVERLSDYVIVTNDNPRDEEPSAIAADILRGMHNAHACLVIADRAQAIDLAVQQAREGDVVLIAGKGHEDYQIFAGQTLPFSDIKQARLALQRRQARLDNAAEGGLS